METQNTDTIRKGNKLYQHILCDKHNQSQQKLIVSRAYLRITFK